MSIYFAVELYWFQYESCQIFRTGSNYAEMGRSLGKSYCISLLKKIQREFPWLSG